MAITRLKRKKLKRKIASSRRKTVLKHLMAKPVLKKEVPETDAQPDVAKAA